MHSTAKVSRHIPDISPTITLRRDKAYTTFPSNRRRHLLPTMDVINEVDTSYSWNNNRAPNLAAYKSALVRNKVCEGLMYLLPGDKNSLSLARPYTADLGAMFDDPYHRFKPLEYNEESVQKSSKIHFSPTTQATRLRNYSQIKPRPADLNSDSRGSYRTYDAVVMKREEDDQAGKGNLPIPVKVGPAEIALQEEVNKILDEVNVYNNIEEDDDRPIRSRLRDLRTPDGRHVTIRDPNASLSSMPVLEQEKLISDFRQHTYSRKSAGYRDYKHLRESEVPRPKLPDNLKSKYLSDKRTEEIWDWLHWDFRKTKLQHFLEVCS